MSAIPLSREPLILFDCFGGNSGNPQGLDATWLATPQVRINELIAKAERVTRRIAISMPQGATVGNTFCVTAQDVLASSIATWLADEAPKLKAAGWKLVLYTGSRMPRVGGVGLAEENATSQAAGAEAGSIAFTAANVPWVLDSCLADFAPSFDSIIFDAMSDTSTLLDTIDAFRDGCESRGWFRGGVAVEPWSITYGGSPRPNSLNRALTVRGPQYMTDDTWQTRDYAQAPIGNAQVMTYLSTLPQEEMHFAVGVTFLHWGPTLGTQILNEMKRRGFIISLHGLVDGWIYEWWKANYGARVRSGGRV